MAKTTYVASKDLVIEGVAVPAGAELLTVETAVPIERALNAISIGSACTADDWERRRPKPAGEAQAAPTTRRQ